MNIVVFGANGHTGRLLTRRALDKGHSAVAVTRHPEDFPFADPQLTVACADVRERCAHWLTAPESLVIGLTDAAAIARAIAISALQSGTS